MGNLDNTKIWTPSWKGVIITALLGVNIVFIRIIGALVYNCELSDVKNSTIRKEICVNSSDMSGVNNSKLSDDERSTIRKEICINSLDVSEECYLCPPHWLLHVDQCYYYSDVTGRKWNQSRDHCKMMGADLLVIKDKEQQEFIERTLRKQLKDIYWIGLQRDGDVWRWVDGGHYNGSLFPIETQSSGRCVIMTKSGYYEITCDSANRWTCQKKSVKI